MRNYLKVMWFFIALIVSIAILGFVANLTGLANFAFFAPKVEQVRYDVFKRSQAYNDGMIRDLQDIRREYLTATVEQKAALRAIAIHRFDAYDVSKLPPDLVAFYQSLNP